MDFLLSYYKILDENEKEEEYTYKKSRQKFRDTAKKCNADILDKLVVDEEDDLTIDIAIFKGNPKQLVLHISGTHGVEGFIGSEIQNEIMTYAVEYSQSDINMNIPTLMLVHGLNPFGMHYLRRVNEKNVDLNRNALFDGVFKDKNNLYKHVENDINPKYSLNDTLYERFYRLCKMGWSIFKNGFTNSKRAMVTGTYERKNEQGLFYGGNELQKSHRLLRDYLEKNNYLEEVEDLRLIDVHSGMGKMGKDTIMISSSNTLKKEDLDELFETSYAVSYTHNNSENEVTKGYEYTQGDVADNYPKLFKNVKKVISVTQEFGTYHNIWVALELILENQAWNYGSINKENKYDNRKLYKVFSPLDNENVKLEILSRGFVLFDRICL